MPTININQIVMYLENNNGDGPRSLEEAEDRFDVKLTDRQREEIARQMKLNEENRQEVKDEAEREADRIGEDYAGNE